MEEPKEKGRRLLKGVRKLLCGKRFWMAVGLLALLSLIVWQLSPVSDAEKQRNRVIVEVRSGMSCATTAASY